MESTSAGSQLAARLATLAAFVFVPLSIRAQSPTPKDTAAAQAKPASPPPIDFSGMLFANYQYRGDRGQEKSSNKFDVERAYLTFRMPAGDRLSIRLTADVFQQSTPGSDSFYRGWVIRAKYAYLQYNFLDRSDWKANARIGLLQTVFIDHDELFWPRWLAASPTERAGYFASSDAGIASTLIFPKKKGELYTTITNGPGYTSREVDRFKDYSARLTFTPWALDAKSPLKSIDLSIWGYKGATASKFVDGGAGQNGTIGDALGRNRWGVHIGRLDPRLTAAIEYASRKEQGEIGANTLTSPREVTDSTGTLFSVYALARPFPSIAGKPHPLSLMARWDRVNANTGVRSKYDVVIGGLIWDLSGKVSMSLDFQENNPFEGHPISPSKIWFAHFVARF